MTSWWRAPLIAAAVATLLCGLADSCYRRQVDRLEEQVDALQREWSRDPQLAAQLERERDIVGMLNVRRDATAFVHSRQPSTYATLAAVLPPPALRALTVDAALKRFRISGPVAMQPAAEEFVKNAKGAKVMKRGANGKDFAIEGVVP